LKRDDPVFALMSYIPTELVDVHEKLLNWQRWARQAQIKKHCGSIEWKYLPGRLTEEAQQEREAVYPAPDVLCALRVERAVVGCPEKHKKLIVAHYIYKVDQSIISRKLHIRWLDLPAALNSARHMVKNRLRLQNKCD